jgi:hypothetical protein
MYTSKGWDQGHRVRPPRRAQRRFLILCEDEKSSVLYLKKFPIARQVVQVECFGTGMNTDSIMEVALTRKKDAINADAPYEAIWVVFDRDSFPGDRYYRAFDLVRNHLHPEVTACWSNECFELWYLLHFGLRQTAITRSEINRELTRLLEREYTKNDATIYEALLHKLDTAIQNGKRLARINAERDVRLENPSTKVHQLIIALRNLSPESLGMAPA